METEITFSKNARGEMICTTVTNGKESIATVTLNDPLHKLAYRLMPNLFHWLYSDAVEFGAALQHSVVKPHLKRLAAFEAKASRSRGADGRFTTGQPKPPKPPRQRGPNGQYIKTPLAADPT